MARLAPRMLLLAKDGVSCSVGWDWSSLLRALQAKRGLGGFSYFEKETKRIVRSDCEDSTGFLQI